jgi:hypothetical protein
MLGNASKTVPDRLDGFRPSHIQPHIARLRGEFSEAAHDEALMIEPATRSRSTRSSGSRFRRDGVVESHHVDVR